MKTRILGTVLGIMLLANTVVQVCGQDSSTAAAEVQSRKTTASKAKRKLPAGSVKTAAGAQGTAASNSASGGSEGSLSETPKDSTSTTVAGDVKATGSDTGDPLASPSDPQRPKTEIATFGAGCFWHVEAEFEWLPGVKSAVSGYSGGNLPNPTYEDVHDGWTGHAEVVQVEYDPSVISYEKLLRVFWSGHDPTQLNRQGPDYGPQYRSVIFYHSPEQKRAAMASYQELTKARVYRAPIVTQLVPMQAFFPAEEYHQNYYGGRDGRPVTRRAKRTRKPAAAAVKVQDAKTSETSKPRASKTSASSSKITPKQPGSGPTAEDQ